MPLDQVDVDKMEEQSEKEMTFFEHLEQLRWHIFRSAIAVSIVAIVVFLAKDFVFNTVIFGPKNPDFATYRFICWFSDTVGLGESLCFGPPDVQLTIVDMGEAFLTHLKVSMILGFVVAFPYIFWEIWTFIKPGLYNEEQKYARGVVAVCSGLFIIGILFGYFVISPFAVTFLLGYEIEGVATESPRLSSFVSNMTMFTVPAGIVFELPVVVYFFSKIGLITPAFMRQYRRQAFVIILVCAAIITPPDIVTQFLIGFPLYVLYEISISISDRVYKQREAELK